MIHGADFTERKKRHKRERQGFRDGEKEGEGDP